MYIKLPYGIVDMAIEQGWERQLAYYCHFSCLYGNNIIYNYSSRSLSVKSKLSKSTVHRNVSFLIEKGLLIQEFGHLKCASKSQLRDVVEKHTGKKTGRGLLTIKVHNNIKYTEWNILARVPLKSLSQQIYNATKRREVNDIGAKVSSNTTLTKSEVKLYKKHRDSFEKKTAENFHSGNVYYLSDATIGRLSGGRSISNVRSMIKFWEEQGLIKCAFKKGRTLDTHITPRSYEALKAEREEYSNTYYYKGRIIELDKRSIDTGNSVTLSIFKARSKKHSYVSNRVLEAGITLHNKIVSSNSNSTC